MNNSAFNWPYSNFSNPRWQYWTLQFCGWGSYALLTFISSSVWVQDHWLHLQYIIMTTISGLVLSELMHKCFKKLWKPSPSKRLFASLIIVLIAAILWAAIKYATTQWLYEDRENQPKLLLFWFSYSLLLLVTWTALYYGIKFYKHALFQQEKTLLAESMAHQAQLKMLRYQLNPHFLFNTLNAISTLVLEQDNHTANHMVTRLSQFLRHSLDNDPMQKVTLDREIEALRLYLDIEKVRFTDRLSLEIKITKEAEQALVPSLLLQPLVENAVKYAISTREQGGIIRIEARVFVNELLLEVSDNGPGVPTPELKQFGSGSGVGIRNTCERLQALYGSEQRIQFCHQPGGGLAVRMRIPFTSK